MMFTVRITSSYDSEDDVYCIHHISSWFHYDVYCTHHISLWFLRWCLLYTSHQLVILNMMLFVHITSTYDSRNDVMCTQHIIVMIPKTMSCAHIAPGLRFELIFILYMTSWLWFKKRSHVHTWHQGYDSIDDYMCTHCTAGAGVPVNERWFHVPT